MNSVELNSEICLVTLPPSASCGKKEEENGSAGGRKVVLLNETGYCYHRVEQNPID
jgi:hypothetical protein